MSLKTIASAFDDYPKLRTFMLHARYAKTTVAIALFSLTLIAACGSKGSSKKPNPPGNTISQQNYFIISSDSTLPVGLVEGQAGQIEARFKRSCKGLDVIAAIGKKGEDSNQEQIPSRVLQSEPCSVQVDIPATLAIGSYQVTVGLGKIATMEEIDQLNVDVAISKPAAKPDAGKGTSPGGTQVTGSCLVTEENNQGPKSEICREFSGKVEIVEKAVDDCGAQRPAPLPQTDCTMTCNNGTCFCSVSVDRRYSAQTNLPGSCKKPADVQSCSLSLGNGLKETYYYYLKTKFAEKNCKDAGGTWSL